MSKGKKIHRRWRLPVRILVFLLLTASACICYLSIIGAPLWLIDELTAAERTGQFAVMVGRAKIDIFHGVVLEDIRIYRKGVVGPPAVEAENVTAEVDYRLGTGFRIRKVVIERGKIRPFMNRSSGESESGTASTDIDVRLEMLACSIEGVTVKKLTCRIRRRGEKVMVDDVKVALTNAYSSGSFEGSFVYDGATDVTKGTLTSDLDPHLLLPIMASLEMEYTSELIRRFEFGDADPRVETSFTWDPGEGGLLSISGQFWLRDCSYQGVSLLRADGTVNIDSDKDLFTVEVSPLLIVRQEGVARGGFVVDLREETVEYDIESGLDPLAVGAMAGIADDDMALFRFEGPARIVSKGVIGYVDRSRTDITATFRGRGASVGSFLTDDCSLSIHIKGPTNVVSNIHGTIYGGEFEGQVTFVDPDAMSTNTRYTMSGSVKDANFADLAAALMEESDAIYEGKLSGRLALAGVVGNGNAARGNGKISIRDGRVFQLPIFGGLSSMMTRVIPGLDFVLRQTDAKAEFVIADGKIHSDKIRIEGDVMSLMGRGDYYLDHRVDCFAQVKLMKEHVLVAKILRTIIYPLTKLFEFRLRGTVSEPIWYPTNFSRDLLERIGLWERKNGGLPPKESARSDNKSKDDPK